MSCRWFLGKIAILLLAGVAFLAPAPTAADSPFSAEWHGLGGDCDGDCAIFVFGGRQTTTSPGLTFGFADITQGQYGFVEPTPIWEFDCLDSDILGVALSRRFVTFSYEDTPFLALEGEIGAAQRFGSQTEQEVWAALYARWLWFPWNDTITTTFAVSTGLNYVTGISDYELARSGNGEGSRLLHYFSPEITFASPDHPDREIVFRMHHRSGIKGNDGNGTPGFALFNYADTGATYASVGLRLRF